MRKALSLLLALSLCFGLCAPVLADGEAAETPKPTLDVDASGTVWAARTAGETLYVASYAPASGQFLGLVPSGGRAGSGNVLLRAMQTDGGGRPKSEAGSVLVVSESAAKEGALSGGSYDSVVVTGAVGDGAVTLRALRAGKVVLYGGASLELDGCAIGSIVVNTPSLSIVPQGTSGYAIATALDETPAVTVNGQAAEVSLTRLEAAAILVRAMDLEAPPVTAEAFTQFNDCGSLSDSQRGILQAAVDAGLVSGTREGGFDPFGSLSRAEAAVLVTRMRDEFPASAVGALPFSDVAEDDWYYGSINTLWRAGILTDEDGASFRPTDGISASVLRRWAAAAVDLPLTRLEAALLLADTLDVSVEESDWLISTYKDCAGLTDAQRGTVDSLSRRGIFSGVRGAAFRPFERVTRADAAAMVLEVISAGAVRPYEGEGASPYQDVTKRGDGLWYDPAYDAPLTLYSMGILTDADADASGNFDPSEGATEAVLRRWLDAALSHPTRAEFAERLVAAYRRSASLMPDADPLTAPEGAELPFTDCGELTDAQREAVLALYHNEKIKGTTDTTFSPDAPLTRAQAAVLIDRMMTSSGGNEPDPMPFKDSIPSYAEEAVQHLWSCYALYRDSRLYPDFRGNEPITLASLIEWLRNAFPDVSTGGGGGVGYFSVQVRFDAGEGRVSPTAVWVCPGDSIAPLPVPEREGWVFTGWWYPDKADTNVLFTTSTLVEYNAPMVTARWTQLDYARRLEGTLTASSGSTVTVGGVSYELNVPTELQPLYADLPLSAFYNKTCILYLDDDGRVLLVMCEQP